MEDNKIIIRSVYKITRQWMEPCPEKATGRYPDSVKKVDSQGDMIVSEKEKNSGRIFIAENERIEIYDGKTFDLTDAFDIAWWDAIKNSRKIALDRGYKNHLGEYVIDGNAKRYGTAEFYVEKPGAEAKLKITKKKLMHKAEQFVLSDTVGGVEQKVRILEKPMKGMPFEDIQTYLISLCEISPEKVIDLYTGGDMQLRILLLDSIDKGVIVHRNKEVYQYGESTVLGSKQETVIDWMKNPNNSRLLDLIKTETYPELYTKSDEVSSDSSTDTKKAKTSSSTTAKVADTRRVNTE
jgi:hypothetical protein